MSNIPDGWKQVSFKRNAKSRADTLEPSTKKQKKKMAAPESSAHAAPAQEGSAVEHCAAVCDDGLQEQFDIEQVLEENDRDQARAITDNIKKKIQSGSERSHTQKAEVIQNMVDKLSMGIEGMISMINYKRVLRGVDSHMLTYNNDIRPISKKYEDSFLRQAISDGERSCIQGAQCECMFLDHTQPFVGVEFRLPWEGDSKQNGLCLPCIRAATQVMFFDLMQSGATVQGKIQRFYNEHSKPGEYNLQSLLICPPNGPIQNLPFPIVRHQRNRYRVYKNGSVHYCEQVGVDFCAAP